MKRFSIYSLAVAFLGGVALTSCDDEMGSLASVDGGFVKGTPSVKLVDAEADGENAVVATLSIDDEDKAMEFGIQFSASEDFSNSTYVLAELDEDKGAYVAVVSKLKASTTYYVRAYAIGIDGVFAQKTASLAVTTEAPETWTLVGKGTFTYTYWFCDENDNPVDDPGVELYQSDKDPKTYKLTPWGNGVELVFTLNEDNSIVVGKQEIGYIHSSYGTVYVMGGENADGTPSSYDPSTKTFSFNFVYVVSAGKFGVSEDAGFETFVLDAAE